MKERIDHIKRLAQLKNLSPSKVRRASVASDFFHVVPQYYPESTRSLFTTSFMLKAGVLPLGFKEKVRFFRKCKVLNLGFLDPTSKADVEAVIKGAKDKLTNSSVGDFQVFLILPEDFLNVMETIYHISIDDIRRCSPSDLEPFLRSVVHTQPD